MILGNVSYGERQRVVITFTTCINLAQSVVLGNHRRRRIKRPKLIRKLLKMIRHNRASRGNQHGIAHDFIVAERQFNVVSAID